MAGQTPHIYRKRRERGGVLMGLCAGIGEHLGLDPILIRLGMVLLTVLHPAGLAVILIYVIFSLFVPFEPKPE